MSFPIFVSMDDNIIYYLVLGAIYLVSKFFKKKNPVPASAPRPLFEDNDEYQSPEPQQSAPQKPSSFEDLLKEISQEYNDRKEPEPMMAEVEAPVEVIEPVREVREKTREEKYAEKRHREIAAIERTKELKRLAAEEEEYQSQTVLELLQEEGGAANAVILSEIMNRKYD